MDMGETLRLAREERGLSVEGLSQRTKISPPLLRAIEANEIGRLPGGIFLKGFLKAYAREVGLNPEDTVARYMAQFESHEENVDTGTDTGSIGAPSVAAMQTGWIQQSARNMSTAGLVAIVALAVGLSAYVTVQQKAGADATGASPVTAATSVSATPASNAANDSPSAGGQAGSATSLEPVSTSGQSAKGINLTIETTGPCWVSVMVDGRTAVYRLMQAGERETVEGGSELVLRVGDPSTFTYAINDVPGQPLGRAGIPVTVRMTAANYQQFAADEVR